MSIIFKMQVFCLLIFIGCILHLNALKFDNSISDVFPSKADCGEQINDSGVHAFPWVVYIPLKSRVFNPDAHVRCAGVLISKRYVATSKTCLQFLLEEVHLGQHDTSQNETCEGSLCKPVRVIKVESRVIDEDLNVILLRLEEDVEFTDYIRPICLPFEGVKRADSSATVYTSGWGLTSVEAHNSLTKKEVKAVLLSKAECKSSGVSPYAPDNEVICVKWQKDSVPPCSGDEGTPVMYQSTGNRWVLEGIIDGLYDSSGKPCSINQPATGTKITEDILQWIIERAYA